MTIVLRAVSTGKEPVARLPGLAAAMLTERDAVLGGRGFTGSPDLSRLLSHLVERTLAGDDDRLTPYSVAVEVGGIGGIDTEFSGAPQGHVDRLRALLEHHYAHDDPADGLCLTLIEGSYRVWIARPEVAYPTLFRRPRMVEWPLVPKARRISAGVVWG